MSKRDNPVYGVRSLQPRRVEITEHDAARIASTHWGIDGEATALPAEVDENFHLVSGKGDFLLKVVPVDEPAELTDLVTKSILHVGLDKFRVPAQRVVPTSDGSSVAHFEDKAGNRRRARLSTFVRGTTLRNLPVRSDLRERLGALLARLAAALRSFEHPAAARELSWDLRHAGRMQAMLGELEPSAHRRRLAESLTRFEAETLPRLLELPAQVVHNDLSRDNVVLADDGSLHVIDFGDVVHTQRINDVAVAVADLIDDDDPVTPAVDFLRGYVTIVPLRRGELDLLYDLMRTRVVTRIVGGEWRSARFPENRAYLGRNVKRLSALLERLPERPCDPDRRRLQALASEVD